MTKHVSQLQRLRYCQDAYLAVKSQPPPFFSLIFQHVQVLVIHAHLDEATLNSAARRKDTKKGELAMSIAASPNVRAAVTIEERANKSSVRAGERRICDDAQTGKDQT